MKPPTWACLFQDPSTVVVSTVLGNTLQATALLTYVQATRNVNAHPSVDVNAHPSVDVNALCLYTDYT